MMMMWEKRKDDENEERCDDEKERKSTFPNQSAWKRERDQAKKRQNQKTGSSRKKMRVRDNRDKGMRDISSMRDIKSKENENKKETKTYPC